MTPQLTDMIFIRNCKQCKFGVHGKAAKCIIGKSHKLHALCDPFTILILNFDVFKCL